MIIIFSILSLLCLTVLILNSKYIYSSSQKAFSSELHYVANDNEWYLSFIPSFIRDYIDNNLIYTKLDKNKIYKELFYSFFAAIFVLVAYFISWNIYCLLLAVLVLVSVILDFSFKVSAGKKSFIDSLDHLVSCFEILTVKSETPLSSAIKVIIESLPEEFYVAHNELQNILQKSEKFGMEQVLTELELESVEEQEFISILLAIHKGTNKSALKKNLQDFLLRQKSIKEEKRKMIVENMQLYMMLPGTVMLIIAMFPLIDMISAQLKGSF